MQIISATEIRDNLDASDFIEALRHGFRGDIIAPVRHRHEISHPGQANSTLLLMPAWTDFVSQGHSDDGYSGVKIVNVSPDNAKINKASVQAVYLLSNGKSGEPIALIDGETLTFCRTSATSALASEYLSRNETATMLMVGAGAMAPWLIRAHRAVRPISKTFIWNRSAPAAENLAKQMLQQGIDAEPVEDLRQAVENANIISAATLSEQPLIKGAWLQPGTHIDLVGGFTPKMREADDEAITRASLFVDTMAGGLSEPGDIVQPLENGIIRKSDIKADLFDLTRGKHQGRMNDEEITLFKSSGASLEDLVGAILIAKTILGE